MPSLDRPTTKEAREAAVVRPQQPSGVPERQCNKCGKTKPSAAFYKRYDHPHLLQATCKDCKRAYSRAWHADKKDDPTYSASRRDRRIRHHYGISQEDYDALIDSQHGVCAGCGTSDPGKHGVFDIDHDHQSGKVRGLLCSPCNRALGFLRDSAETAMNLARYIQEHEGR